MIVKNIIFDLGGVILNIDYNLTIQAFKSLGIEEFDSYYAQAKQSNLFDNIETGLTPPTNFYDEIKAISSKPITNLEIETAWNKMLLDLPVERIDLLRQVSTNYNIFLLSNTNEIHYNSYIKNIQQEFNLEFNSLFKKAYYSHKIGLRKPNSNCFQYVLAENKLNPSETLFIDDSIQHIKGANELGLKTVHLVNKTILNLFNKNGILTI